MKFSRSTFSVLILAAAGLSAQIASAGSSAAKGPKFVEGELIVKFRGDYTPDAWKGVVRKLGGKTLHVLTNSKGTAHHVRLRANETVAQAIEEFGLESAVDYVQPNFIYRLTSTNFPNDPNFSQQWGMDNTGQLVTSGDYSTANPGSVGKDLDLPSAWGIVTDCSAVTVAVVDTGVNYNHSDLAANMWSSAGYPKHGYDFVNGTNDPMDLHGHGTHVAGIVGAVGNNGTGVTGICWKASLMAVRVLDPTGTGTTANITAGVNFAVTNGAKVINLSLTSSEADTAFKESIENAGTHGVAVVAAAGNEAADNDTAPTYPCDYALSNLLCVAALDQAYSLASFSNYGVSTVQVGAPGTNILSTWAGANTAITDNFHSGGTINWTVNGAGWGYQRLSFELGGVPTPMDLLSVPTNWNGQTTTYAAGTNSEVYKTFSLSSANAATLNFQTFTDTIAGQDFFDVYYNTTGGNPFLSGTQLEHIGGRSSGQSTPSTYDITPCGGVATCSVGYRLNGPTGGAHGVAVLQFSINELTLNTTSFATLDGTSMAAPQVAGILAMLLAYNPAFEISDAIAAVVGGGTAAPALSGKTTSGKAANAYGALTFIAAPAGFTAR